MKQVFLTGASGAIGSALVPALLEEPDTQLWLLLRAPDDAALAERLRRLHRYWGTTDSPAVQRVHGIRGDIVQPDLGLTARDLGLVTREATHMVHCAASVKLTMPLAEARASAVTPTQTILKLARQACSSGRLVKLDLVSTVGVWGRQPGTMPETPLPQVTQFHNTYEAAKSEAEQVVWQAGEGLPCTVHRPSMVVGDSRNGKIIHFQVFYHLCEFLSGVRTGGVMPNLGSTRLDTVPADWVAQVLRWSGNQTHLNGRILHLCAGPDAAIPLLQLQARVRQLWAGSGRRLPALKTVNRRVLAAAVPLLGLLLGARSRRALRGLKPVLAYLDEDQSFGNDHTRTLLEPAGLRLPAIDDYLGPVLRHYLQRRTLPAGDVQP